MNVKTQEIYSEVYGALNMLGDSYISKLPTGLFNMIKEEKLENYNPSYIDTINLEKQKIKKEALAMIALFHLNYWCESDEEKDKLKELFNQNEKKHQEKIREMYNPDNIFKKHIKETEIENEVINNQVAMVEYKESIFKKIINKVKNIFHIR